jgi:hypothetical protein
VKSAVVIMVRALESCAQGPCEAGGCCSSVPINALTGCAGWKDAKHDDDDAGCAGPCCDELGGEGRSRPECDSRK